MTHAETRTDPAQIPGIEYWPAWLSPGEVEELEHLLTDLVSWQREQFRIFGRTVDAPRTTAWFGDHSLNYRYAGTDHPGNGWPEGLTGLRERVSDHARQHFNFVVLNRYQHGGEYMGWHRDDERGAAPRIASLSLGGVRRFRIQSQADKTSTAIDLTSGSLLVFDASLRHQLARSQRICQPRINLTFRTIAA